MRPFLKWAGGKRWLFTPEFISNLPKHKRYIEPFIGGGAGFFALKPSEAIISDANSALINLYRVVRDHPIELKALLAKHQKLHNTDYYYHIRESSPDDEKEDAARFLYLNRTCWNGLFRLNKNGKFNVPIGTKTQVILENDDFELTSEILKNATIEASDFEEIINRATVGDLVFADPPYTVAHNNNGFIKYNEKIFSWDDQIRLRNAAQRAIERGSSVIITNADHHSVRELYDEIGVMTQIGRPSVISGNSKGRTGVTELIVRA